MLLVYSTKSRPPARDEQKPRPTVLEQRVKEPSALVSATTDPRTLRVSFFCRESDTAQSEVVCNVYCTEIGKLDIEYLYHEQQVRPIASGAWDRPQEIKMAPSTALRAEIELGVMYELWNTLLGTIKLGSDVPERERGTR